MVKRNMITGALILGIVCMGVSSVLSAQVNMQEGKWEVTMETKIEGLPFQVPVMPYTATQCLTKEDIVPKTANKDQKCETIDQKVIGNKVTWKVKCADPKGTSEGEGEMIYNGNSYSGRVKTKTSDNKSKQPMISTTTMKGKYLGACSK